MVVANHEGFIVGRIYQRVLNEYIVSNRKGPVSIIQGIDTSHNLGLIIDKLFSVLCEDTTISIRKLPFGHELLVKAYPKIDEVTW